MAAGELLTQLSAMGVGGRNGRVRRPSTLALRSQGALGYET